MFTKRFVEFENYKSHILKKISETTIGEDPFYHLYLENFLPEDLYNLIKSKSIEYKLKSINRKQDNKLFETKKFSLSESKDRVLLSFCNLFSDKDIQMALFKNFFFNPEEFINDIEIFDKECEFVYTPAFKTQDIHIDIPSKYLSLVFYLPDEINNEEKQLENSTILYDKDLIPLQKAKYLPNSVCIFSQHFYSYHGFNTTIDRNAIVLFYINKKILPYDLRMDILRDKSNVEEDIKSLKELMIKKFEEHKLIEYKDKSLKEISEKSNNK
jgi:hypothetical protein